MEENNIEDIRSNTVEKIKEKIKRNPKYLNPCNKERQEDIKRLKFATGYDFTCWLQKVGIVKDCKQIEIEYRDKFAMKLGFKNRIEYINYKARINGYKDDADRVRTSNHERGICFPISDNEDYPQYLGNHLAERKYARKILPVILGKIEKEMPINYPEYDFIVEKDTKSITVDVKSRRLSTKYKHWNFPIRHNNGTNYFLFLAFNEERLEEKLKLLHILLIRNDEKVRRCSGNGCKMDILCDREGISISNDPNSAMYFEHFKQYDYIDNQKIKEYLNQTDTENMKGNQ